MKSGVQILVSSLFPLSDFVSDEHKRCRICGGVLTEKHFPSANVCSSTWTDEAKCRSKESVDVCEACAWFLSGHNRQKFWSEFPLKSDKGVPIYIIAADSTFHPMKSYGEFIQYLRVATFSDPTVIMLRGKGPKASKGATQKHIEWKANDAITFSRQQVKVTFTSIQIFDDSLLSFEAEFNADRFLALLDKLAADYKASHMNDVATYRFMNSLNKGSLVGVRLFATQVIMSAIRRKNIISPNYYLAALLAPYLVYPETDEEINPEKSKSA